MKLEYWTSIHEPRSCLRQTYPCSLADFEPYFNGLLTIENVPVSEWKPVYDEESRADKIEMRVAFDKYFLDDATGSVDENRLDTGEMDQVVYDVLRFVYKWNKDDIGKEQGWECIDGHSEPLNDDPKLTP